MLNVSGDYSIGLKKNPNEKEIKTVNFQVVNRSGKIKKTGDDYKGVLSADGRLHKLTKLERYEAIRLTYNGIVPLQKVLPDFKIIKPGKERRVHYIPINFIELAIPIKSYIYAIAAFFVLWGAIYFGYKKRSQVCAWLGRILKK